VLHLSAADDLFRPQAGRVAFSLGYFIMLLSTLGGLKNVDRDLSTDVSAIRGI
jgi:hypothetical protein